MNIVILGPGAVGSLWAVKLRQAGHRVSVWSRRSASLYSIQLDDHPAIDFSNQTHADISQADLVVITVKSWQVSSALESVRPYLQPETMLLFMHNGMGVTEELSSYINHHPCLIATTSHGALRDESSVCPVRVCHTGAGETWLGAATPSGQQCQFMTDVLNHAFAPVCWHDNIEQAQWKKLAVNCVINPLTAIHQCANGQLASYQFSQQISALITEISQVMNAEGIKTHPGALNKLVFQVIENTRENHSSMYQDILSHRTTEIDYITGYLLKIAGKHQIAVPENEKLCQQIKQMEEKGQKR
ncbi:2-dehydropantoate 2-reductase [Vibrio aerogenes CECT 7868]|uniref:2-dehydropantoate 2-reductase n=1 Tax=Vibrio aerogenes CECT 7868 TaxID=1216006 RepID=A0A1M5WKU3_9VIBR|nr:2-dehydropantoate 2-reductase [Vibrio aerogenes]SHH88072.1 2-dehydropantoate 2-reductase [Vibrio aerogenes CECT 7868]